MFWVIVIGIFGGALCVTAVRLAEARMKEQVSMEADGFEMIEDDI